MSSWAEEVELAISTDENNDDVEVTHDSQTSKLISDIVSDLLFDVIIESEGDCFSGTWTFYNSNFDVNDAEKRALVADLDSRVVEKNGGVRGKSGNNSAIDDKNIDKKRRTTSRKKSGNNNNGLGWRGKGKRVSRTSFNAGNGGWNGNVDGGFDPFSPRERREGPRGCDSTERGFNFNHRGNTWRLSEPRASTFPIPVRNSWVENTVRKTDENNNILTEDKERYKQMLREGVWSFFEQFSLTLHRDGLCKGKIPFFVSCEVATKLLIDTPEFQSSAIVKVNPSLAQHEIRKEVIRHNKTLLMPRASLTSNSLFFLLHQHMIFYRSKVHYATTQKGIDTFAKPIGILNWRQCGPRLIHLYVVASVVVSTEGVRLGKGKGFADLEWAILYELGAVVPGRTVVVTTVHQEQIVSSDTLPQSLMSETDLPVDIIVTPEKVYRVKKRLRKPTRGVDFDKISDQMMEDMPVLQELLKFREKMKSVKEKEASEITRLWGPSDNRCDTSEDRERLEE